MERIKKVGTRPAQGLNIVHGERTEQNGTERLKKVGTRPAPQKKVMEERNLWMKRKKQNVQRRRKTRMELYRDTVQFVYGLTTDL